MRLGHVHVHLFMFMCSCVRVFMCSCVYVSCVRVFMYHVFVRLCVHVFMCSYVAITHVNVFPCSPVHVFMCSCFQFYACMLSAPREPGKFALSRRREAGQMSNESAGAQTYADMREGACSYGQHELGLKVQRRHDTLEVRETYNFQLGVAAGLPEDLRSHLWV
jgi:hypothetical protein